MQTFGWQNIRDPKTDIKREDMCERKPWKGPTLQHHGLWKLLVVLRGAALSAIKEGPQSLSIQACDLGCAGFGVWGLGFGV